VEVMMGHLEIGV